MQRVLLMDEISTGLDSATTFLITKCLSNFCHILEGTLLVALLQPPPETYNLFDDVMLMSQGHIVFHGPREEVRAMQVLCYIHIYFVLQKPTQNCCCKTVRFCLLMCLLHEIVNESDACLSSLGHIDCAALKHSLTAERCHCKTIVR